MRNVLSCPFCQPNERVLLENETAYVVMSNPRKVPGHMLVIPKKHYLIPKELSQNEIIDIFNLIFKLEDRLIPELGIGCDIRQNYRPFQKQSNLKIDHIHFHVIPRSFKDYIYNTVEKFETDIFVKLDDLERKSIEKLIKG